MRKKSDDKRNEVEFWMIRLFLANSLDFLIYFRVKYIIK